MGTFIFCVGLAWAVFGCLNLGVSIFSGSQMLSDLSTHLPNSGELMGSYIQITLITHAFMCWLPGLVLMALGKIILILEKPTE